MGATNTRSGGCVTGIDERNDDRLTAFYDANVRDVYRYVHRLCLDHAIAEDVTQDVFLSLVREPEAEVSVGWLMRSARNRLIDIVRRESNHRDKLRTLASGLSGSVVDEATATIESVRMNQALATLRPEHRISLMLHYVDGCSVTDLAEALDRSYKGAEGLLSRARAALRVALEDER